MHSKPRSHSSIFGVSWSPVNTALAIMIALLFLIFLLLFMTLTAQPAQGQNSAPATAREAAKMPQYAARLAHRIGQQTTAAPAALARRAMRPGPLQGNDLYDNGPTNGNTDGWNIGFGYVVSDSFVVPSGGATVTGMTFAAWLFPGDTLPSLTLGITSAENGGTVYFNQTLTITQSGCVVNGLGFDICNETTASFNVTLNSGTYWVNLQNGQASDGDSVYWDENSGVGCTSQGCPSSASATSVGTIPSESFTILGETTTSTIPTYSDLSCPAPQNGFHDLHDFSSNAGPSGLAIDTAAKLYGTFANGGSHGAGLLYDFAQRAGHWFLTSLYNFLGAGNGSSPNGVIVGPEGVLYGAATGGIQNCGNGGASYCGLIYEASPGATPCATALCSWDEMPIYEFTGNTDAAGGSVTAFDSAGNLYGISGSGGAYGHGAVFELTPLQGGWTEKILYSFTGGSDGGDPTSLLLGQDGNLYGTTAGGGNNDCADGYAPCGVVFQLVPSGGGWTENVLYAFMGTTDGYGPGGLIQDSQGNLYGFSTCYYYGGCEFSGNFIEFGLIFRMSPSGGGWSFNVIYNAGDDEHNCEFMSNPSSNLIHGLTLDAAGNLYAAEGGSLYFCLPQECQQLSCGQIVRVFDGEVLVTGDLDIFENITSDANGNLYGTTSTCGFESPLRTSGMVWQYSP